MKAMEKVRGVLEKFRIVEAQVASWLLGYLAGSTLIPAVALAAPSNCTGQTSGPVYTALRPIIDVAAQFLGALKVIGILLIIGGIVFAGIRMVFSGGKPQQKEQAWGGITAAVVGAALVFGAPFLAGLAQGVGNAAGNTVSCQ